MTYTWILIAFSFLNIGCVQSNRSEMASSSKGESYSSRVDSEKLVPLDTQNGSATDRADYINVKDFDAKGDGATDDTEAINRAVRASINSKASTIYFPEGTYIISGQGIRLEEGSIRLLGESHDKTTLKGDAASNLISIQGEIADSLVISNMRFDGSDVKMASVQVHGGGAKGRLIINECVFFAPSLYGIRLNGVDNAIIKDNIFKGIGNGKGMGIYLIDGCSEIDIDHNKFLYLYNGVYVVGKINQRKGSPSRKISSNTDISFTNNYLDFGWYLLSPKYQGGGSGVTYTKNAIIDKSANFGKITKNVNVRILQPVGSGTITTISSNIILKDEDVNFLEIGVKPGDLVRIDNKNGLVKKVGKNTLEVDEWITLDQMASTPPPAPSDKYNIYRLILGKIVTNTNNRIVVNRFYDFFGNIVTPKSDWSYEVLNSRPNYPFYSTINNSGFTISSNVFKRGWADQISIQGSHAKISDNIIEDGQDMGITLEYGGNHEVYNNRINHQRTGIWIQSSNNVVRDNEIVDCQWGGSFYKGRVGYIYLMSGENNRISQNRFKRIHVRMEENIKAIVHAKEKAKNSTVQDNSFDKIE